MIAIVIFADSLMSSRSFAAKRKEDLKTNREIFAFGVSNLCACISGCAPTSASVSRTAASEQFRGKTQMVSAVAIVIVGIIVSFFSGLLYYMPQPVLGGIVLAALVGVVEVSVIRQLLRCSKGEAIIWGVSAVGVLLVGTLFGVIVGVILSFIDVIIRITSPPQAYLGVIPNRDGFFDLSAHKNARPIKDVLIYRFSARLIFANIEMFRAGIMKGIKESNPKTIIIDASGINSIDSTAADGLKTLINQIRDQNIKVYFAEQTGELNKHLLSLGVIKGDQQEYLKKTIQDVLDINKK